MMLKLLSLGCLLAILFGLPVRGRCGGSELLYGAVIYIASSPGDGMTGLLASEIAKRKLPLVIASNRESATYILAGYAQSAAQAAKSNWEGKAVLADARTRTIVWSAEFRGSCPKCDSAPANAQHILAEKFVRRLQKDLFEKRTFSDRIDSILAP